MDNTIGFRISHMIKALGETRESFGFKINASRTSISHWISGARNPNSNYLHNICVAYPQLNGHWLLTGKGGMFLNAKIATNVLGEKSHQVNFVGDNYENVSVANEGGFNYGYSKLEFDQLKKELGQALNEKKLYQKLYEQSEFKISVLEEKMAAKN